MKRELTVLCLAALTALAEPPQLRLTGDWEIDVTWNGQTTRVAIQPPTPTAVTGERHGGLRPYRADGGGWTRGTAPLGIKAQECTVRNALVPDSLVVRTGDLVLRRGRDYELTPDWGTVGRLPDGELREGQGVTLDYTHHTSRLDAIVADADGRIAVRRGRPHVANPEPAPLAPGDRRLAAVWLPLGVPRLTEASLMPVLEDRYPEPPRTSPTPAERLIPKALARLRAGQRLRVLAWGDSVTVGTFVPDWQRNRWQEQFVARLRQRFPSADIELVTEAWGGRNSSTYLAQPPGAEHNYREKVLDARPDLIVSEFVNDAWYDQNKVREVYGRLRDDFRAIGAEWIILTPHYVRPDWMGLKSESHIDDDPRPYVAALRRFAADNGIALADASLRWGRLWRQGIPYSTLLLNAINHPNALGMSLFADALMALF